MRLGVVILPERRWAEASESWRTAEALGFTHGWTYDHLSWRSLRDGPWFSAIPTLTAAATVTERLRLGTLVASPNFRHPVPFAKELMTLDDISDGRLIVGLGAGGTGWDATVLGTPPWSARERSERFEELLVLVDRLLRDGTTSFEGRFYSAHEARMLPGCVQRPRAPIAVAATGPRGIRLAAKHADTWITNGCRDYEEQLDPRDGAVLVASQMQVVDAACEQAGRDPASLARLVLTGFHLRAESTSVDSFCEMIERYAAVGVTDLVVHWPRESGVFAGDRDAFEAIVSSRAVQGLID